MRNLIAMFLVGLVPTSVGAGPDVNPPAARIKGSIKTESSEGQWTGKMEISQLLRGDRGSVTFHPDVKVASNLPGEWAATADFLAQQANALSESTLIVRYDAQHLWFVNPSLKVFHEMTMQEAKTTIRSGVRDLYSYFEHFADSQSTSTAGFVMKNSKFNLRKGEGSREISGFPCHPYRFTGLLEIETSGSKRPSLIEVQGTLWLTPTKNIPQETRTLSASFFQRTSRELEDADILSLTGDPIGLFRLARHLNLGTKLKLLQSVQKVRNELKKASGYVIYATSTWSYQQGNKKETLQVVTSVEEIQMERPSEDAFNLPKGYARVSLR